MTTVEIIICKAIKNSAEAVTVKKIKGLKEVEEQK
jgi:hypothetical protein